MPGLIMFLLIVVIFILAACIKIVPQAHAYVIERFGMYVATLNAGINFIIPIIDRVARRVSLKEQVVDLFIKVSHTLP